LVLAAAVKKQFGDTLEAHRQNMAIIENVCRLLEAYPVRRVIFMSSAAVYGEETENTDISELTPVNPTSFYGINKYTGERLKNA
jgi:UDP-glucose 4-epimerase